MRLSEAKIGNAIYFLLVGNVSTGTSLAYKSGPLDRQDYCEMGMMSDIEVIRLILLNVPAAYAKSLSMCP